MQRSMATDWVHNEDRYLSMEPHWTSSFHSSTSAMFCFDDVRGMAGGTEFQQLINGGRDEDSEDDSAGLKKRRLSVTQVRYLEKSFESEKKLEPERKAQLAMDIGLHPKQVAIWFQNRRARLKTKQLEKDYISLKAGFDSLKNDHETLIRTRENLTSKVLFLREKLKWRNKENTIPEKRPSSPSLMIICNGKRGDGLKPAISDVLECDGSSNKQLKALNEFETEFSDICREKEDSGRNQSVVMPKLEIVDCDVFLKGSNTLPIENFYNFGRSVDDDQYYIWPY